MNETCGVFPAFWNALMRSGAEIKNKQKPENSPAFVYWNSLYDTSPCIIIRSATIIPIARSRSASWKYFRVIVLHFLIPIHLLYLIRNCTVMKTSDPIAKPVQRDWYLVNLKVFLILLVIFHHAGPAYSDSDNWIYQPSLDECAVWLRSFFAVNASFLMGLYFLFCG